MEPDPVWHQQLLVAANAPIDQLASFNYLAVGYQQNYSTQKKLARICFIFTCPIITDTVAAFSTASRVTLQQSEIKEVRCCFIFVCPKTTDTVATFCYGQAYRTTVVRKQQPIRCFIFTSTKTTDSLPAFFTFVHVAPQYSENSKAVSPVSKIGYVVSPLFRPD